MSLQAQLEVGKKDYQRLQAEYSSAVESRQRLDAQKSENESVKKEFGNLVPENVVYKMVGPVLLKQEQAEAKGNVDKRLEFIEGEIVRVEGVLKDLMDQLEAKKLQLVAVQTQMQQQSQPSA